MEKFPHHFCVNGLRWRDQEQTNLPEENVINYPTTISNKSKNYIWKFYLEATHKRNHFVYGGIWVNFVRKANTKKFVLQRSQFLILTKGLQFIINSIKYSCLYFWCIPVLACKRRITHNSNGCKEKRRLVIWPQGVDCFWQRLQISNNHENCFMCVNL